MKKLNLVIFFSNTKGLKVYKHLKNKKKFFSIKRVFLGKKHLNDKILKELDKRSFEIINKINSKNLIDKLKKLKLDFIIIAGFHYIFKKKLINCAKFCTINLHSGRVPNYRGGSPLNWQIINNEKYFYLSILKVDAGIDSGDLIMEKKFIIKRHIDIKNIHKIVDKEFPKMAERSILNIYRGYSKFKKQDSIKLKKKTYRQRMPEDGKIIWNMNTNLQIYNLIRAIAPPYPGAFSYCKKNKITILKSKISNKNFISKNFGEVTFFKNKIYIKCKKGFLQILEHKGSLKNKDILI